MMGLIWCPEWTDMGHITVRDITHISPLQTPYQSDHISHINNHISQFFEHISQLISVRNLFNISQQILTDMVFD
jgi:hypothetical protein